MRPVTSDLQITRRDVERAIHAAHISGWPQDEDELLTVFRHLMSRISKFELERLASDRT